MFVNIYWGRFSTIGGALDLVQKAVWYGLGMVVEGVRCSSTATQKEPEQIQIFLEPGRIVIWTMKNTSIVRKITQITWHTHDPSPLMGSDQGCA